MYDKLVFTVCNSWGNDYNNRETLQSILICICVFYTVSSLIYQNFKDYFESKNGIMIYLGITWFQSLVQKQLGKDI